MKKTNSNKSILNTATKMALIFNLTIKEAEIINLLFQGYSSQEISHILQQSIRTVEVHRYNILKKTGSSNSLKLFSKLLKLTSKDRIQLSLLSSRGKAALVKKMMNKVLFEDTDN